MNAMALFLHDAFTLRKIMVSDGHIILDDTDVEELDAIVEMEREDDTAGFIIPYSLEQHREAFARKDVLYKSVYAQSGQLVGFVILVVDPDGQSVEFRRIVIRDRGRGYGKWAVALIDEICKTELKRRRLWLDVFEDNVRGQHIYETHGYRYIRDSEFQGRTLRVYEKRL